MDLETKLREFSFASQPMQYLQDLPFGIPSSQSLFQDLHNIDQFHVNNMSSSFNQAFGVQNHQSLEYPFGNNFTYGGNSSAGGALDVIESKPFMENSGGGGHGHVMDNFQYGGYGFNNIPQRNHQLDMMVANNQSFYPFNNDQETKPMNFVVPDEVSCISPMNYYKKIGVNKNIRPYATSRRTFKVRKKSTIVKGQWTENEDRLLIQLVEQHGLRKWSHIAQMLPGRIGKQCRERWHNHLRPDIKKDLWTDEEDKVLIQAHAEIGNKWAEIAKRLPGRTENSIKNHWNATKRRQYSKRKCRTRYPRGSILQEYIKSLNLDKNPPIDYRRRNAGARAMANKTSAAKVAPPPHSELGNDQFCYDRDRLVPNFDDFGEVPDFCFDENLFEEGCSIDSLLDDMPNCAPPFMDEKEFEGGLQGAGTNVEGEKFDDGEMQFDDPIVDLDDNDFDTDMSQEYMASMLGIEVKKEMDLTEMMAKVNEIVDV